MRPLNLVFALVILLLFREPLLASPPQGKSALFRKITAAIAEKDYPSGSVGVCIQDVSSGKTIVAVNADSFYIPASVSKLVTGAMGLELLGLDYTFQTNAYIDGDLNRESGELDGTLYIQGRGDPGFLVERMWLFVQHLSHLGITSIRKDLVLDDFFFDSVFCGPGFGEEKTSRSYEATIGALSAGFNCVAIHVRPGDTVGAPVQVDLFPPLKDVHLVATAKTIAPLRRDKIEVKTEKVDDRTGVFVYGSMHVDAEPRYIFRKTWHSWKNFGNTLQGLFDKSKITLAGTVRHEKVPDSLEKRGPFYTFESLPFTEYLRHMFKYSSNFAAEMIFKTIAAENDSIPGSWEGGERVALEWWKDNGLPGTPVIKNGSGMGKVNRLKPAQVVALLRHAHGKKEYAPDYVSLLSVAGVDGTLKDRFARSRLKGIMRAKTGTLNDHGVSTLAGYVLMPEKTWAFALLINNKNVSQITHWELQQEILHLAVPSE
ncbi:MAG: D-alanyl-D-alanine carboxypeptidase/D-alanyl-D-alanine-endopeptidase [Chitinivibrionales bacterium]|nr:D-alanyl-D-alanine carboxypeptidase/D-alanyl-D-alanine-endopeptidase [Chitinivibrionales bacterium]